MPTTHSLSVTLGPDQRTITISTLPPGTIVKHKDEVVWTVINADTWKLSIVFKKGATLNPPLSDVSISGSSVNVNREMVSPKGPVGSYPDDYTVTLKKPGHAPSSDSELVIERNVEPPGAGMHRPYRPRKRRSNVSYPEGAGAPGRP